MKRFRIEQLAESSGRAFQHGFSREAVESAHSAASYFAQNGPTEDAASAIEAEASTPKHIEQMIAWIKDQEEVLSILPAPNGRAHRLGAHLKVLLLDTESPIVYVHVAKTQKERDSYLLRVQRKQGLQRKYDALQWLQEQRIIVLVAQDVETSIHIFREMVLLILAKTELLGNNGSQTEVTSA